MSTVLFIVLECPTTVGLVPILASVPYGLESWMHSESLHFKPHSAALLLLLTRLCNSVLANVCVGESYNSHLVQSSTVCISVPTDNGQKFCWYFVAKLMHNKQLESQTLLKTLQLMDRGEPAAACRPGRPWGPRSSGPWMHQFLNSFWQEPPLTELDEVCTLKYLLHLNEKP